MKAKTIYFKIKYTYNPSFIEPINAKEISNAMCDSNLDSMAAFWVTKMRRKKCSRNNTT